MVLMGKGIAARITDDDVPGEEEHMKGKTKNESKVMLAERVKSAERAPMAVPEPAPMPAPKAVLDAIKGDRLSV